MGITPTVFKKLKRFNTATFAIWDSINIRDTSLISEESISKLHANVIILGLNPSTGISFPHNFHCGRYDKWYADAFDIKPFAGAYMTDLMSLSQPDAQVAVRRWKEDTKFRNKNLRALQAQFKVLGVSHPTIVCIGKSTHELLCEANIPTGKVWYLKHPNSYRIQNSRATFIKDAKKLANQIKKNK